MATKSYGKYIESAKGIIYASEFEIHATFLRNLTDKIFIDYKEYLYTGTTHNHIKVRDNFLMYVEALRNGKITNDDFDVHISRLREYKNVNADKQERYRYTILFSETKKYFWKVIPFTENLIIKKNSYVEHLHRILSTLNYENATLVDVLKPLGLLELVGDCNIELVNVMKKILFCYHPDRNKDQISQDIFLLVNENVYKPVWIVFEDFEKYSNCAYTSCQLDEFLTWQISEIKEIRGITENLHVSIQEKERKIRAIYNHLQSMYEPCSDFGFSVLDKRFTWQRPVGSFTMEHYRNEKADILSEKDKLLIEIGKLINMYINFAQIRISLRESNITDIREMRSQINNSMKMKACIKECKIRVKRVNKRIIALVQYFIPLLEPMIEKYQTEINYLKDVCVGKINFEEKWKTRYEWDEDEQIKCKRKIKSAKLNTFVDERRLNSYQERVQELQEEKLAMEYVLSYMMSEINMPSGKVSKFTRKVSQVSCTTKCSVDVTIVKRIVESECICIINEFKRMKKLSKAVKTDDDMNKLMNEYLIFKENFKTEEEKFSVQDNSKMQDKKELLALIKEARNIENEANEERRAKENVEKKANTYKNLLLQIKNGEVSIQQLKSIDIE